MTSPLDEALKRAVTAVEQYGPPEQMIAVAAESLAGMPEQTRLRLELEALEDALLHVAEQHAGPHQSCATCDGVRNGLAVTMGILRAEVDLEFAAKPNGRVT